MGTRFGYVEGFLEEDEGKEGYALVTTGEDVGFGIGRKDRRLFETKKV